MYGKRYLNLILRAVTYCHNHKEEKSFFGRGGGAGGYSEKKLIQLMDG